MWAQTVPTPGDPTPSAPDNSADEGRNIYFYLVPQGSRECIQIFGLSSSFFSYWKNTAETTDPVGPDTLFTTAISSDTIYQADEVGGIALFMGLFAQEFDPVQTNAVVVRDGSRLSSLSSHLNNLRTHTRRVKVHVYLQGQY